MNSSALSDGLRHLRGTLSAQQRQGESDEQLLHAFTSRRDDSAFTVLVRRHGSMVLQVCRRVLGHEQDAEDAFQATFLVLAQSAAALQNSTKLASFLHGIAYRTAMKAKQTAARRRNHEGSHGALTQPRSPVDPAVELSWSEVRALLDEEISHLPSKYRIVFVLFHLEDLGREEIGRRLDLKERTVSSRLTEARKRLGQRLARRGVELTAVLAAAALVAPSSALPFGLMATTIETSLAIAAGENLAEAASASVVELVKSMMAAMMVSKAKLVTVVLLAVGLLTVATSGSLVSWYGRASGPLAATLEPPVAKAEDRPRITASKSETRKHEEIQGRVLDPDGKPKAGAKLLLHSEDGKLGELGVSASDGLFSVAVPKKKGHHHLIAQTDRAGMDFIDLKLWQPGKPIELRLVKDNVIRGRVVNTEGKPIAGVGVSVHEVHAYLHNSLESFLTNWQKRPADYALPPGEKFLISQAAALSAVSTDADGRFAISGVGSERVAVLYLRGAGIANATLWIVNRAGFDPKPYNRSVDDAYRVVPKRMNPPSVGMALRGPNVAVVAEPERPIRGTVTDAESGKGVSNVVVHLAQRDSIPPSPRIEARTDAQGRYEFRGAHKKKIYQIHIVSNSSSGYLAAQVNAPDTVGYGPLNVVLRIKKGTIVTGKIIDRATGKSVPGFAQAAVLANNPFVKDCPPGSNDERREETAADGTFRVVTIAGPVLLMGGYYPARSAKFDYIDFSKYRAAVADPEHPECFSKAPGGGRDFHGFNAYPRGIGLIQGNFCKVLEIKPGTAVVHQNLVLERASILEVKIQDAEGRPVVGVWATDFASDPYIGPLEIEVSTCPVYGLEARKPRMLIFYEPKRKIIGSRKLQGDEKQPLTVTLGPMASLKGRLLDADGKPLAGVAVNVSYRESEATKLHRQLHDVKQSGVTDAQGAFTIHELIPELAFELSFQRGKQSFDRETKPADTTVRIKSGDCRDLGAIRVIKR